MPIKLKTDREAANIKHPGKHSLGGNVYLQISRGGGRSYVARITDQCGRRRDIGLGSAKLFSLAEAREKARLARIAAANGSDPTFALKPAATPTFATLARQVHVERAATFKNSKHRDQWINTLEAYAFPFIGDLAIDKVTASDVMALLRPIWVTKQETARRVLQRVAFVIGYSVPLGHREADLPVKAIRAHLPPQKRTVRHHPAVPFKAAPTVYSKLLTHDGMAALALQLVMLTGCRSSEAREARWAEFDLDARVWKIPASRMKAGVEHRVPLSTHTVDFLAKVRTLSDSSELVFPNMRGKPLSDTAISKVFKQCAPGFTVHGWRSTFKDWARERTSYSDEISELALAHVSSDKTRAAYARSDLFDKRRDLMEEWSSFLNDIRHVD
ncbi:tyrosine-type recombinase/integrase [Erythrobacter aurantius]|uniref:tyrosine-type recombinase/integrase n=1 Tax=Erythrobacter aurantius TaxID=2909249 RepID=UPI002079AD6B|nr:site-specific integrase [Erythrobacter aurantius]